MEKAKEMMEGKRDVSLVICINLFETDSLIEMMDNRINENLQAKRFLLICLFQ